MKSRNHSPAARHRPLRNRRICASRGIPLCGKKLGRVSQTLSGSIEAIVAADTARLDPAAGSGPDQGQRPGPLRQRLAHANRWAPTVKNTPTREALESARARELPICGPEKPWECGTRARARKRARTHARAREDRDEGNGPLGPCARRCATQTHTHTHTYTHTQTRAGARSLSHTNAHAHAPTHPHTHTTHTHTTDRDEGDGPLGAGPAEAARRRPVLGPDPVAQPARVEEVRRELPPRRHPSQLRVMEEGKSESFDRIADSDIPPAGPDAPYPSQRPGTWRGACGDPSQLRVHGGRPPV